MPEASSQPDDQPSWVDDPVDEIEMNRVLMIQSSTLERALEQSPNVIQCGSPRLDALLSQMPSLNTIEISGPTCSGKSQLVYSMALESALKGQKVIFIDCDLTFSKKRLYQMAKSKCDYYSAAQINRTLSLIHLRDQIFQFDDLIHHLSLIVCARDKLQNCLIIVDSFSYIFLSATEIHDSMDDDQEKLKKRRQEIISQFWAALKTAILFTNSVAVFTRLTTEEYNFKWNQLLPADLGLELQMDEENTDYVHVNIVNRTVERLSPDFNDGVSFELTKSGVI